MDRYGNRVNIKGRFFLALAFFAAVDFLFVQQKEIFVQVGKRFINNVMSEFDFEGYLLKNYSVRWVRRTKQIIPIYNWGIRAP